MHWQPDVCDKKLLHFSYFWKAYHSFQKDILCKFLLHRVQGFLSFTKISRLFFFIFESIKPQQLHFVKSNSRSTESIWNCHCNTDHNIWNLNFHGEYYIWKPENSFIRCGSKRLHPANKPKNDLCPRKCLNITSGITSMARNYRFTFIPLPPQPISTAPQPPQTKNKPSNTGRIELTLCYND